MPPMVLKTSGKQALVYFCNALAGSPLADAKVKLWERYYEDNHWQWREQRRKTGADGIAVFDLVRRPPTTTSNLRQRQSSRIARLSARQQLLITVATQCREPWRIYAFTDRPAYRPKETVQWKFIARRYNGSVYSTPSGQTIEFQINDPRGAKVKEDKVT